MTVQQTLGWFDAYPEKQYAFRDLAETVDTVSVSIIATKQPMTLPYKICDSGHFEFFSTSNFISIHSPSVYKLSMILFMHKVHFDEEFWITHRHFTLFFT